MLKQIIDSYLGKFDIDDYFNGLSLPEGFALPNSILIFTHDWYPIINFTHDRYTLVIPAVPVEYSLEHYGRLVINPGKAFLHWGGHRWQLEKTYSDMEHGYRRMLITFELPSAQQYLPINNEMLDMSPEAEKILEKLCQAYNESRSADASLALFQLLRLLKKSISTDFPKSYSEITVKAINWIRRHPCEIVSLQHIASHAHTSVSNLRQIFKRETGMTIGKYMSERRVKMAKYHLMMTTSSLENIAELCGFSSVYAFCHFFRKNVGMPPGAFRKMAAENS
ncbi:MAG: helix-turn-helix transcriptional regulator [Victivallales bacterium]|nr:helix-turn-helix transcriptional regulator [Victivallales bacterium]